MRRILHGEQEFEFYKPIFVGDVLTGDLAIADVYEKEGGRGGKMTFMVTEIEYKNQKGENVAFARGTLIETGQAVSARASGAGRLSRNSIARLSNQLDLAPTRASRASITETNR